MTVDLGNVDTDLILETLASSNGSIGLAAERLAKKIDPTLPYGSITEYDLEARIASFDIQTADKLSSKLRILLIVKLYNLIHTASDALLDSLGDLKPAELARTHTSIVNSFATLTAPATKVTFDFDREIMDIAREFPELSIEDVRGEVKRLETKVKQIK